MSRSPRLQSFTFFHSVTGRRGRGHGLARRVAALLAAGALAGSAWAGVRLEKPPVVTTQPQGTSAAAGGEAVLFVRGYGGGQLSFQWLRDGTPVEGAAEPVLRLTGLTAQRAGDYQAVVSNAHGRSTSAVARVTVLGPGGGWSPASGVVS